MTNKELEKATQFILEQQVQFAANQQQTVERVTRLETNMADLARAQAHNYEVVTVMARAQAHNYEVVTVMAREQTHMDEVLAVNSRQQTHLNEVMTVMARAQTHLDERMDAMLHSHKHTQERLDAFIGVLERYISERRNGSTNGENAS